jgi:hypothetical protein
MTWWVKERKWASGGGVGGEVIPAAVAADFVDREDLVGAGLGRERGGKGGGEGGGGEEEREAASEDHDAVEYTTDG